MSKNNCYLCVTDEGILLDIFGDAGKAFRECIETCLSVKVKQSVAASTKICHKCAYELESCERFLAKYRRFRGSVESGSVSKRREHCGLCGETPKKLRLLHLNEGRSLKNLLQKLQQVFIEDSIKENIVKLSVCLDCRYNLDVLSDLKTIHRESVKKLRNVNEDGLKLSDLPKTKTSVVIRKTTFIPEPKLNGNSSYESDASSTSNSSSNNSSTMPLTRKRVRSVKEPVKGGRTTSALFRSCEECETQVENGIDMYRYHRSGRTVCRECWLTMDPEKMSNGKRKRLGGSGSDAESGTKLCAVFLKDVLSNPSKYSNVYKVEKDKDGNKTFLITDESSESEEKDQTLVVRRLRGRPPKSTSATTTSLETIVETRKGVKRSSGKESKIEPETVKKGKRSRRSDDSVETSPVPVKTTKARNGLAVEVDPTLKTRSRRSSSESTTASTSLSPEIENKSPPTEKRTRPVRNASLKKRSSDEKSHDGESSSSESRVKNKRKEKIVGVKRRDEKFEERTRSNSFTGSSVTARNAAQSDGNSSEDSSTPLESRKTGKTLKISKNRTKTAKSDSELDKPYTCSVCRLGCKNKLVGKSHELTHEKQPKVKLRRVVVSAAVVPPETIVEETPLEVSVPNKEEEEEEEEKKDSQEDKNENAAVGENPQPMEQSPEKPEIEETSVSEKPVSEEKPASPSVREETENERTTSRDVDDGKENEETHLPLEKDEETIDQESKPVDADEPVTQENKPPETDENEENKPPETDKNEENKPPETDKNEENKPPETDENEENAANENKENDNSEERINNDKDEETNDNVKEPSVEREEPEKVEIKSPEAPPTPPEVESEKPADPMTTENVEEETQDDESTKTLQVDEPMEVTEQTEEKEKIVEETVDPVVEDVEKPEEAKCEKDSEATEAQQPEEAELETEVDDSLTKTASETNETQELVKIVEKEAKEEENEKANEEVEKNNEEEEEETKSKEKDEEEKEKLNEKDEEEERENCDEKDVDEKEKESSNVTDEKEEEPEEKIDSSRDEDKEKNEKEVSLEVEENKKEEKPADQSDKEDDEEKAENKEVDKMKEAEEPSNESATIATECLREVFDLASAEVKKRLENENSKEHKSTTAETLENISLEIQNGGDMPSLELEAASNDKS